VLCFGIMNGGQPTRDRPLRDRRIALINLCVPRERGRVFHIEQKDISRGASLFLKCEKEFEFYNPFIPIGGIPLWLA
jgi:hypothetical protein